MTRQVAMVRYKVHADRAAENETAIRRVFEQLAREQPSGLRYGAFKSSDGQTFIHFVVTEGQDNNPLNKLDAFQAFTAGVRSRCEEMPVRVELAEVGSFHLIDA